MTYASVMTPTGNTPRRTVRIPDNLWRACQALADSRGETISTVIRRALQNYLEIPK